MSYEWVCGLLVAAGVVLLLLAGFAVMVRFLSTTEHQAQGTSAAALPELEDTHRLSVEIAEALMRNRVIEPGRLNEVAQIVSLKLELHRALAAD